MRIAAVRAALGAVAEFATEEQAEQAVAAVGALDIPEESKVLLGAVAEFFATRNK